MSDLALCFIYVFSWFIMWATKNLKSYLVVYLVRLNSSADCWGWGKDYWGFVADEGDQGETFHWDDEDQSIFSFMLSQALAEYLIYDCKMGFWGLGRIMFDVYSTLDVTDDRGWAWSFGWRRQQETIIPCPREHSHVLQLCGNEFKGKDGYDYIALRVSYVMAILS